MAEPHIDYAVFRELSGFIQDRTGIALDQSKDYLIETRLGPLIREFQLDGYADLLRKVRTDARLLNRMIDEISTNETSFFRDNSPFELLKYRLLPELMDRGRQGSGPITIWSAASSTGQEVYSIGIACREIMGAQAASKVRMIGTDISDSAVRRASLGAFSELEIGRGMSADLRDRYFTASDGLWKIKDELRAMASFRQMNLLEPFSGLGSFDIIFCRNVAIYFDAETRKALFERLAKQLRPNGALIIGSSETMIGVTDVFQRQEHMRCAYYTLRA